MKKFLLGILFFTLSYDALAYKVRARCADFATQAEAQQYMRQSDANYLDGDQDGEACECLPGGSKYGSSICRR
ncbi:MULTISPECIES: excalibur calcium-binding domain-containing protein [Rodentibacter]|uniref:Excalibur calcium-binding domain-containing protein n=1 Tax=Rodentibacter pneumotropicus TaxID=758 RepID=A0A1V3K889_9PAST|nr:MULTISPECIES: excalibur calcium-binding domain-containing protein [Rodentibacter]MCQ9120546.1 excalibur calcium-binding domain-containing protein [Rodentibacter pneumotropicus]OOF69290.1 hypothetical protein BKG95_00160 [Rodentibacter pneumotropicus]TGZ99259.1 hypothetical protein D3M79_06705 [Rodentibacter pneumotropicus]THA00235.1 hypothetical protein D3M74_08270 [Rodentibacter pneumotropicus]THA07839.1 hypothetical protein D3M77_05645 [Rodentibacter pneumotropicus]